MILKSFAICFIENEYQGEKITSTFTQCPIPTNILDINLK